MKLYFILIAAIPVLAISVVSFAGMFSGPERPAEYACTGCNIVIITVDTLRADHVSASGYFEETTPAIDSAASRGIYFSNAFSQIPHTPPSHWSMFTGLYPNIHLSYTPEDNGSGLLSLPDILSGNGYVTAAFTSSHVLSGFSSKFDYFNGRTGNERNWSPVRRPSLETAEDSVSWLSNHSDERFFLWVHYYDPHSPYEPPEEHDIFDYAYSFAYSDSSYDNTGISRRRTMREEIAKYDGEVNFADSSVGMVIEALGNLQIENNTVVIIMSDHGECFGEHNFTDFGYSDDRACVFHGKTLYDQEVHIPIVMVNPMSDYTGAVIGNLIESVDIFPTILGMVGLQPPESNGESLVPLIVNGTRKKDYVFLQTRPRESLGFSAAIRTDRWKLVRTIPYEINIEEEIAGEEELEAAHDNPAEPIKDVKMMLFDTLSFEDENLLDVFPDVSSELDQRLGELISIIPSESNVSQDTERLLKSLGYM